MDTVFPPSRDGAEVYVLHQNPDEGPIWHIHNGRKLVINACHWCSQFSEITIVGVPTYLRCPTCSQLFLWLGDGFDKRTV